MRIGLDLDNTLVCYDHVFASESIKLGLVSQCWRGSKQELRDELQTRPDGERLWQTLQGRAYGYSMGKATLYPGVATFLVRARERGDQLFIVSHKTKFGHFDATKTPIRKVALAWMESKGFFDKSQFGIESENVFFTATRGEKIEQITRLNLDFFIDDLEEVFAEKGFPPINKVLFNVREAGKFHNLRCDNWTEIGKQVLGPVSDPERKILAQTICPDPVSSITGLSGGGNSRVYRVGTNSGDVYALKFYPDLLKDSRPRLRNEVKACDILEQLKLTPRSIAHDEELNIALFEWIDGKAVDPVRPIHISQALHFVAQLKELSKELLDEFPEASEAGLSVDQLFSQIDRRIQRLESTSNLELTKFLATTIKPLWSTIKEWSASNWPDSSGRGALSRSKQTLSPSDFGFHNALNQKDDRLCFIDLEYFGRDDPVKLSADFLWHPGMDLKREYKQQWLQGMFALFVQDLEITKRFRAAWPIYGIRWALIILNEFHRDDWQKRVDAEPDIVLERSEIEQRQLRKAEQVCKRINKENLECPYV